MSEDINRKLKSGKKIALVFIALGLIVGGAVGLSQEPLPGAASGWTIRDGIGSGQHHLTIADVNADGVNDIFYWLNPMTASDLAQNERSTQVPDLPQVNIIDGKTGAVLVSKNIPSDYPWTMSWYSDHMMFRTSTNDVLLVVTAGNLTTGECNDCQGGTYEFYGEDANQTHLLRISIDFTRTADQIVRLEQVVNFTQAGWEYPSTTENIGYSRAWYLRNWESFTVPGTTYTGDVLVVRSERGRPGSSGGANYCSDDHTISFIDPSSLTTLTQLDWRGYGPLNLTGWGETEKCLTTGYGFATGPLGELEQTWDYPYFYTTLQRGVGETTVQEEFLLLTTLDELAVNMTETADWILNCSLGTFESVNFPEEVDFHRLINARVVLSLNASGNPAGVTCYQTATLGLPFPFSGSTDAEIRYVQETFPTFRHDFGVSTFEIQAFCQINSFNLASGFESEPTFRLRQTSRAYLENLTGPEYTSPYGQENASNAGMPIAIFPVRTSATTNASSIAVLHSGQVPRKASWGDGFYPVVDYAITFLPQAYAGVIRNSTYLDLNDLDSVSFTCTNTMEEEAAFDHFDYYHINTDFDVDQDGLTDLAFLGTTLNTTELSKGGTEGVLNGPFFTITQADFVNQTLFFSITDPWRFRFPVWRTDANADEISDGFVGGSFMFFSQGYPEEEPGVIEARFQDAPTRILFIVGIVMIAAGAVLLVLAFVLMRDASLKIAVREKTRAIILVAIAVIVLVVLFSQLGNLTDQVSQDQGTQVGVTAEASAMASLTLTSGVAALFLFFGIFFAAGLYLLVTPRVSDGIVALNQIFFAKTAGLKATMEKRAMTDEEVEKSAGIRYKIVIVPPFGRQITSKMIVSRVLSVMALAIAIGLNVFEYGTLLYDAYGVRSITTITGLTDTNFIGYISSLFIYLIIPGIIAVPLFFWLVPTSWLLNDAGVLFYKRKLKAMDPEDIEPVGGWFSNYLKGFLGIGALVSYVKFIIESPITASVDNFSPDIQFSVLFFVFGFILIAGLSMGLVVTLMYGITLPYNAGRLYDHLDKREVDIKRKKIHWDEYEKLTMEATEAGYLRAFKKSDTKDGKKGEKQHKGVKKEKAGKKSKKDRTERPEEPEPKVDDHPDPAGETTSMPPGGGQPPGDDPDPNISPAGDFSPPDEDWS